MLPSLQAVCCQGFEAGEPSVHGTPPGLSTSAQAVMAGQVAAVQAHT